MTYLLLYLIIKAKSRLFGLHKEVIHFVGLLKKEKKNAWNVCSFILLTLKLNVGNKAHWGKISKQLHTSCCLLIQKYGWTWNSRKGSVWRCHLAFCSQWDLLQLHQNTLTAAELSEIIFHLVSKIVPQTLEDSWLIGNSIIVLPWKCRALLFKQQNIRNHILTLLCYAFFTLKLGKKCDFIIVASNWRQRCRSWLTTMPARLTLSVCLSSTPPVFV